MSTRKFELLPDQSIEVCGRKLFRIRALISFGDVEAGETGGYVERDANLSHDGNAWVYGNASLCWCSHVGSECGTLTAFTSSVGISVTRGCFIGTLEEFEAAVKERHGNSQIAAEYALLVQFIRLRLGAAQAKLAEQTEAA